MLEVCSRDWQEEGKDVVWDEWQSEESKCGNGVDIETFWLFWRKSLSDFWFCRNKDRVAWI